MPWKVTTGPASEPLTRSEVKTWLKVESDVTADDDLIDALITAARKHAEGRTGLSFLSQTIQEVFDAFPDVTPNNPKAVLRLTVSPVIAVSSISYKDGSGNTQTWGSSNYIVDTVSQPARIAPAATTNYPTTYDEINAITITYTAGWSATTAAGFPSEALVAMKLWIAGKYDNRADYAKRYMDASEAILDRIRVSWFADGR